MKYTYLRIDDLVLMELPRIRDWLQDQPDAEYREDYQCWFVLVGSQTHTWLAIRYPEVLKYHV